MEWNTTQNKNNSRVNDRQGKCLNWNNNGEYYKNKLKMSFNC